jgi:predicted dehydrogenase
MGRAHSMCFNRMAEVFYPMRAEPKLITLAGRNAENVAASALRHGYSGWTTDWREMISDDRIDIFNNTMPTYMHAQPCIAALQAGKHVIVEKPFALTLEEARSMYKAAQQAQRKGLKNLVAFNYRFVPALRLARKLIRDGSIGEIYQYRSAYIGDRHTDPASPYTWRMDVTKAGGGALTDINSHAIDMMRFLTGQEVESVMAWMKTMIPERADAEGTIHPVTIDEVCLIMAKWGDGKVASLEASRVATGYKNSLRIEIHGSEGGLMFDLARGNELLYFNRRDPLAVQGFRTINVTEPATHDFCKYWWPRGHNLGWEHNHLHMLHHFMECVAKDEPVEPWAASFADGLRCQEVIEAAKHSHSTGRWIDIKTL